MSPAKIIRIDPASRADEQAREAGRAIAGGGLVIIPTETVYGIAASMADARAIERLYAIKKRDPAKPFSLLIDSRSRLNEFCRDIPVAAYKLIEAFWPGPLTIVLKSSAGGSVGLRLPDHEVARLVVRESGVPVACPSANISGNAPPAGFNEAMRDLKDKVDLALDAGPCRLGKESSVVDLSSNEAAVLREGALARERIEQVLRRKTVLFVCTGNSCRSVMAQGLLRKRLREAGRDDVDVYSAGVSAVNSFGATEETVEVMRQEGVDVSMHISQRVSEDLINRSDIILVMERLHEERIAQLVPRAKNRVFLLKEFAKIDSPDLSVPDPIGRPREYYRQTLALIKEAVERLMRLI